MTELMVIVIAALLTRRYASKVLLSGVMVTEFIGVLGALTDRGARIYNEGIQLADSVFNKFACYQIKHIFLIDRESGIQIEEVSSKEAGMLNGDAISAMFSAIQSFVQDAFCRDQSSKLTNFSVGNHSIWVAHGSQLMLACVVVGEVPKALKRELDQTLNIIQSEYVESLSDLGERESVEGLSTLMTSLITGNGQWKNRRQASMYEPTN